MKDKELELMEARELVFRAAVGSPNYNLATPTSDKDYKAFVYPTIDDLYEGIESKYAHVTADRDIEYHDIRRLPNLLVKGNVNFLEVLFSKDTVSNDKLHKELLDLRDDIAKMNLPYLWDACMGMFNKEVSNYRKQLDKGNEARAFKYAASAVRIADFLSRYFLNGYKDMGEALRYEEDSYKRKLVLGIKTGELQRWKVESLLDYQEDLALLVKRDYKSHKKDEELEEELQRLVREHTLKYLGL